MKRSEMLVILKNFLSQDFNIDLDYAHNATNILLIMEVAGMLPPLRDKIVDGKFVGYSNMQVPEWDEEL
jgi:hypothetical protein